MTFLRVVTPLDLFLSMISRQTLRVCPEGKPVPTFPDDALPKFVPRHQTRNAQHRLAEYDRWAALRAGPSNPRRRLVGAGHAKVQRDASIPWLDGPQLLRTERVYSPFAKTFLVSRDEDLRPGAMSAAGD